MKAAICTKYGPPGVIEIRDVITPVPKPGEILIRIHAAAVNSGDSRIRGFNVPRGFGIMFRLGIGLRKPRQPILGTDFAGIVEALGDGVTAFKIGDAVIAALGAKTGAHAEYITISEKSAIAHKPKNMDMAESASLLFGGLTALSFLRGKAKLQPGETILINGASGAVGCAAVQIAKYMGADITAICSARNSELVASLGANQIIDYKKENVFKSGKTYDVIMDNVGNMPWKLAKHSLNPTGRLLGVTADLPEMIRSLLISKKNGQRSITGMADTNSEMLAFLSELAENGNLHPVIDKTYTLEHIVDAYSHVDSHRKRGSVIIVFE